MKIIVLHITFLKIVFASDLFITEEVSPCNHPLLELANKEGIKAVPLKDILLFKRLLKKCENEGGKKVVEKIVKNDWDRDYKTSRRMASWTSTHAMCVFVSFGYYFLGKIFATKPKSS